MDTRNGQPCANHSRKSRVPVLESEDGEMEPSLQRYMSDGQGV